MKKTGKEAEKSKKMQACRRRRERNSSNPFTNQQFIGCKDLCRGLIVKEWVLSNQKRIDFKSHNKVIVKMSIEYFHECWKRRCSVLHEIEVQRKVFKIKYQYLQEKKVKRSQQG